jgi:hypothetical protein
MTRAAAMFLFVLSMVLLRPAGVSAHGAHARVTTGAAAIVSFDDGHGATPGAWRCSVLAPGGDEVWAEGATDGAGRFAFVPDRTGTWRIRGYGADGHGAEVVCEVDEAMLSRFGGGTAAAVAAHDHSHDHLHQHDAAAFTWPRRAKLITGVSLLVGVFGLVALARTRQG